MATYTCKFCGSQRSSSSMAGGLCNKSPHKKHELLNATEKLPKYTCKFCGYSSSSASFAGNSCNKSPHKKHELLG